MSFEEGDWFTPPGLTTEQREVIARAGEAGAFDEPWRRYSDTEDDTPEELEASKEILALVSGLLDLTNSKQRLEALVRAIHTACDKAGARGEALSWAWNYGVDFTKLQAAGATEADWFEILAEDARRHQR